jgi:hypothetical protein
MIKHNISTVQVFMTSEYNNFCMILGNRALNIKKINRIIKQIENGNDMLQYYPIQVRCNNNKLEILDGQHRFFICIKLKRPVYYILVLEQKDMIDIASINSNVEKWSSREFINCYIQKKNPNYIRLQEFISCYKINAGTSINLLYHGHPGAEGQNSALREKFETGKFEILKWDEAVEIAELCKLFSAFQFYTDRAFVIAVYRIRSAAKVNIDELVAVCNKNIEMLTKKHTVKDYIYNIEAIANKNKHKRVVLI